MTIHIPAWITRKFIVDHARLLTFVYGASRLNRTYFGQAAEAKGCSNAFHVPTMKQTCKSNLNSSCYWDREVDLLFKPEVDRFISYIPRTKPIILFPKIGVGRSELSSRCPLCYEYLINELDKIAYKERPIVL